MRLAKRGAGDSLARLPNAPTVIALRHSALIALAPLVSALAADAPAPDSAEPLIREAARNSPLMLEQELRIAQVDAFRFRGWRQYMPYISANYQAGYFNMVNAADPNAREGEGKLGGSYGISAYHPVYHWGAIEAEKKYSFARENMARSDAAVSWRNLVGELRSGFLEAVVNKARVALLEKRAGWAKERLDSAKQELAMGRIVDAQLTAITLDLRHAELELTRRKIELASQLARLRSQSGATDFEIQNLPDDLPDFAWDDARLSAQLDDYIKLAEAEAPEARSARYADEAYANQMVMAESREKPQFNVGASLNQSPVQTNSGFGMQTFVFVGVMGTWNIFDRDTTRENVRALGIARKLVEAKLTTGTLRRRTELRNSLTQMKASRDALALRSDIVKLRAEAHEALRQKLTLGLAKRAEVNAAEDALLEARVARLNELSLIQNAYHTFMSGILLDPTDTLYVAPSNDR